MYDKLKFLADMKKNDIDLIIKTNNLQTNTKDGVIYYDNSKIKNFTGMYFKLDIEKGNITIDGSLHKYFNSLQSNKQENHSSNFTIKEMLQTFKSLENNTNINFNDAKVKRFEIGVNLYVSNPPIDYMKLIKGITPKGKIQLFNLIENPKFKNKSELVTCMHKDNRKYYKIYDKIHELQDKRQPQPQNTNILRVETVSQRVEKLKVNELTNLIYIKSLLTEFFETWNSIEFERKLIVPKGTNQAKTQLIKEIIKCKDTDLLISNYRNQLNTKEITPDRFRTIREFIKNDWNEFKTKIIFEPFDVEREFRKLLNESLNSVIN